MDVHVDDSQERTRWRTVIACEPRIVGRILRTLATVGCALLAATTASCASTVEADPVTACTVSGPETECERDQRFLLTGAEIVVAELTTTTEENEQGTSGGWITADFLIDGAPEGELSAQLHIVDHDDAHETVIDPHDPDSVLARGGEGSVTWDFSDTEYPAQIATGLLLPNVFLVISDGSTDITVRVIEVEVS